MTGGEAFISKTGHMHDLNEPKKDTATVSAIERKSHAISSR